MIALPRPRLRSDELIGLIIAVVAHLALIVALTVHALRAPAVIPPPPRVTVNLTEDVGLVNEGPQVAQEAQASVAPTIAKDIAPPPAPAPEPKPVPKPSVKPEPKPSAKPSPKPSPKPSAKPTPQKKPEPPRVSPSAQQRPASATPAKQLPKPPQPQPAKTGGGSRLGDNFLAGAGSSEAEALIPASQIGASEKASLVQAISRQIKPEWQGRSPQGLDAEKLVTILSFSLNPDGTLAGRPTVVRQEGINDANRAQAGRHAEIAVSAVQRAAPFKLPKEYYEAWKKVSAFRFDKALSQ